MRTNSKKTAAKKGAKKREKAEEKRLEEYDHIEPRFGTTEGRYGVVFFRSGRNETLRRPSDIERICLMLDIGSWGRFHWDVNKLKTEGKLDRLFSLEELAVRQAEKDRQAKEQAERQAQADRQARETERREAERDLKFLEEEAQRLHINGISNHRLARTAIYYLLNLNGGATKEDLDDFGSILKELTKRNMMITIGVRTYADNTDRTNRDNGREVVSLLINPKDLFGVDVSAARSALEAKIKEAKRKMMPPGGVTLRTPGT